MFTVTSEFNPTVRGSVCSHCGSDLRKVSPTGLTPHEHAIDTGVDIDFEGVIAFCESCVLEMGSLLGMVTAAQNHEAVQAAQFDAAWEAAHREDAERELASALGALEAVRKYHLTPVNEVVAPVPVPTPEEAPAPAVSEPAKRKPGRPAKQG